VKYLTVKTLTTAKGEFMFIQETLYKLAILVVFLDNMCYVNYKVLFYPRTKADKWCMRFSCLKDNG